MKFNQALAELGLTDKEPEVYMALLNTPGAQPASIIASRAGVNRTTAYKTLIKLVKRGLATKTQRHGVTCFFAENPEDNLTSIIEERQRDLESTGKTILDALPLLIGDHSQNTNLPKVRYYEGVDGVRQIYEAILKEGTDVYRYGDISKIYDTLGVYTDEYIAKRNEIGFVTHAIMPLDTKKGKDTKKNKSENREVMFIPGKLFPIDGEVRIFGNKVAIISLVKSSPIGILIESEVIAKMFLSIFMLTWEKNALEGIKN